MSASITLLPRPERGSIAEDRMRFDVLLHGRTVGDLFWNMTGYTGSNLPLPGGGWLYIGEQSLAGVRREIARVNAEWRAHSKLKHSDSEP